MKIDEAKNYGKSIEDIVCDDCKKKIVEEMKNVSKFDLIRPNKVAKKFREILCYKCFSKVLKRMRGY